MITTTKFWYGTLSCCVLLDNLHKRNSRTVNGRSCHWWSGKLSFYNLFYEWKKLWAVYHLFFRNLMNVKFPIVMFERHPCILHIPLQLFSFLIILLLLIEYIWRQMWLTMLLKMHGFKSEGLWRLFTTYVQKALPLWVLSFFIYFFIILLLLIENIWKKFWITMLLKMHGIKYKGLKRLFPHCEQMALQNKRDLMR